MKSTGPKTPRGKRRSSQNARRHGLLSNTIVLPGEDRKAFARLLTGYLSEFQPSTPTQYDLVETMTVARWRLMRIWGMEKANIAHEIANHPHDDAPDHATLATLAFRKLADSTRSLDLQHRYDARLSRQYHRALQFLQTLQSREKNVKLPNELSQPESFQRDD